MSRFIAFTLIFIASGVFAADREAILNFEMEGVSLDMGAQALTDAIEDNGYMLESKSDESQDEHWWIYRKSTRRGLDRIYIESVQGKPQRLLFQIDHALGGFDVAGAKENLTAVLGEPARCRDMEARLRCTWQDADAWIAQLDIDVYPNRANYLFKRRR